MWTVSVVDDTNVRETVVLDGATRLRTSYEAPIITGVRAAPSASIDLATVGLVLPTAGGGRVVIDGDFFGPVGGPSVPTVRAHATGNDFAFREADRTSVVYTLRSCSVTGSHGRIECEMPEGIGSELSFEIEVAGQRSLPMVTLIGFAQPSLASVEVMALGWVREIFAEHRAQQIEIGILDPSGSGAGSMVSEDPLVTDDLLAARTRRMSTTGGEEIVIRGSNLGRGSRTGVVEPLAATYGPAGAPLEGFLYEAAACRVTVAHAEIRCTTAAGVGTGHLWRVVVGGLLSEVPTSPVSYEDQRLRTDYRPPVLVAVGGPGRDGGPTRGGQVVSIEAHQLGPIGGLSAGGASPVLSYGGHAVQDRFWMHYDGVLCNVTAASVQAQCFTQSGTGKDHAIRVTIAG